MTCHMSLRTYTICTPYRHTIQTHHTHTCPQSAVAGKANDDVSQILFQNRFCFYNPVSQSVSATFIKKKFKNKFRDLKNPVSENVSAITRPTKPGRPSAFEGLLQ